MRIDRLVFERYGIFTDRELSFDPEAAIHIVLGANEAGKTSALSAIGDFIFGFGARTVYDFKHDSKVLRIGGTLRHSDGRAIAARRRKGNKNTLVGDNDEPLPDNLFDAFTAGMSRETFRREFGLTAESLRSGGAELLDAGGRLAETLAASSAGMSALSGLTARLKSEADELFTSRKSGSKPFYTAVEGRDQADQKLRDSIVTRDAIKQAKEAFEAASDSLERLNESHGSLGKSLALCQRALRVRPSLARLDGTESELTALSDLPLISDRQMSEWRKAISDHDDLQQQIGALEAAMATNASELEALRVDEGLLSEGATIDALRERLGAVRKAADDLPRRRQARDGAIAALDEAARKLGLSSHADVLKMLPNDIELAQARDLLEKRRVVERAIDEAGAQCTKLQKERDEHAAQDQSVHIVDAGHLRQRFEALGDVSAQAERLLRNKVALAAEVDAIAAALSAMTPPVAPLDNLRRLPIPDAAVITTYAERFSNLESDLALAKSSVSAKAKAIEADEAELARLSRDGAAVTRANLSLARQERDVAIVGLKASLHTDQQQREDCLDRVVRSSQTIDAVTDRLLTDTERTTLLADIQHRLETGRREHDVLAGSADSLKEKSRSLMAAWRQVWAPCGVTPDAPQSMRGWRERVETFIDRLNACDARKMEIDVLEMSLSDCRGAIAAFLESAGRVADGALSPAVLYREAKARLDELQAAWTEAQTRSVTKARIEREFAEAHAAWTRAQDLLAQYAALWPAAMDGIGLGPETTAAQADAAMVVWQSVPVPKLIYEREGRSVKTIEDDLQAFDRDVFRIVDHVAPQMRGRPAEESLAKLMADLDKTRRDREGRQRLEKAQLDHTTKLCALAGLLDAVTALLHDACRCAAAHDIMALPAVLDRIATRQDLENEQAKIRRDLPQIADGRDEAALRQERLGLDLDLLQSRIELETLRQKELLKEIEEASALKHQKKGYLEALTLGRNAEVAAAERAEANTELLSIAENWLRRAAAARLGVLAIERHRAKVQDPLIASAGALFAEATNRAFAGLAIGHGDDDQPILMSRRASGESVTVDGLSEGTRDQLFLSLRLALLAQRPSEPMPFIGDDLLTSFDEARTGATLRLLAAAGERQQIILFTHHRHVAEIAEAMPGRRIDVIEL